MKLLFLGTASGLSEDQKNYHSNMILISDADEKLLIDCGTDIRFSLAHANFNFNDVNTLYISHLHADHAGGLEWLGFNRRFNSQKCKPTLVAHHSLVKPLWNQCLAGGMDTLTPGKATLYSYFEVNALADEQVFSWGGAEITLVKTIHMIANNRVKPSHGLLIKYKGNHFFLTTDTQFHEKMLMPYYLRSKLIFHDCETAAAPSGVHAHFDQLAKLSPEIKAKMWLYHYNDGPLPNAKKQGFLGFVKPRQVIELI